jgi:hypothetical protein
MTTLVAEPFDAVQTLWFCCYDSLADVGVDCSYILHTYS